MHLPTRQMKPRPILALETEWEEYISDTKSVGPALQFLKDTANIPFWLRRIPSSETLFSYLERGVKEKKMRILYFAMHGSEKSLEISGHDQSITLEDLAKRLKGQLKYKDIVVHFGACSFMQADKKVFQKFKDFTGARIVSGYTEEIPFISSMLLDMAYFNFLQEKGAFDSVDSKFIKGVHAELIKELGFVVY